MISRDVFAPLIYLAKPVAIWQPTAFLLNIILKGIPIGIFFFSGVLVAIFNKTLVYQLIVIFVVVEFWFTKNITGRRLIGIRWYFGEDQYGREKLMYECRANDEYISFVSSKLFWILQLIYVAIPGVLIATIILISPVLYQVDFGRVIILLKLGGHHDCTVPWRCIELILFLQSINGYFLANSAASQKQFLLR